MHEFQSDNCERVGTLFGRAAKLESVTRERFSEKPKQFNAGEGSTNCSSFAIKRCTCIPLEYNRGSCLEKRLLRLGWLYPRVFVPARRRAMEKTNFPCGERMAASCRERDRGNRLGEKEKNETRKEGKKKEINVRFPRLSDRACQREQTYPNLTL